MQPLKVSTRIWAISIIVLIVGAFFTMRRIGLPEPEVIQMATIKGRFYSLAGRVFGWRTHAEYPNGRIKARGLSRGPYLHQSIVHAEYYDPEGILRSRVVDGNGFGIIFDNNSNPLVLVGYINGLPSGPYFVWDEKGKLVRAEYLDRTGNAAKSYLTNSAGSISSAPQQPAN